VKIAAIKQFLLLSIFLILSFSVNAVKADVDGLYQIEKESAVIVPIDNIKECAPPNRIIEGTEMCVEDGIFQDKLALKMDEDGNLEFATLIWFFNGHICGLHGIAESTSGGWIYKNTQGSEWDQCILDINVQEGNIVLNARDEANCRSNCGARGRLYDIKFPINSKIAPPPKNMACVASLERCRSG